MKRANKDSKHSPEYGEISPHQPEKPAAMPSKSHAPAMGQYQPTRTCLEELKDDVYTTRNRPNKKGHCLSGVPDD